MWCDSLDSVPHSIRDRQFWQYGCGSHASERRRLLGSILLSFMSGQGTVIQVRHLVVNGSSPWIIGRNVTEKGDIIHTNGNYLRLRNSFGKFVTLTMVNADMDSYFPKHSLHWTNSKHTPSMHSCLSNAVNPTWKEQRRILDRVRSHVCGHSSYQDMKLLLQRNGLWDTQIQDYLLQMIEKCDHCALVSPSDNTIKVSLSSMTRGFNDLVCVDHLYLDRITVMHVMDATTRYSAGSVVSSPNTADTITVFEAVWIAQFWAPSHVLGDNAFSNNEFKQYLDSHGITFRSIPPRRHNKNVLESKHRVLRDICTRILSQNRAQKPDILIQSILRISNDLYVNDIASSQELAKGYTRPISNTLPVPVPHEILEAHNELIAKRKLNKILRSKAITDKRIKECDFVQLYIKKGLEKRGTWTPAKPVLKYDSHSGTVTVAGEHGKRVEAAIEDVCHSTIANSLSHEIQSAIDHCSRSLVSAIDDIQNEDDCTSTNADGTHSHHIIQKELDQCSFTDDRLNDQTSLTYEPPTRPSQCLPQTTTDPSTHSMQLRRLPRELRTNEIELIPGTALKSSEQKDLQLYYDRFKSKEFMLHQAHGLPGHITSNTYSSEQNKYLKACSTIHVSDIPCDSNVISSHVLYKIKDLDDGMKFARLA